MLTSVRQKFIVLAINRGTHFFLSLLVISALFSYMMLANSAVHTVTELQKIREDSQSLSMKVSELETRRLSIDNTVDSSLAARYGFVEVNNQNFIVAKSAKSSLTLKN